MVKFGLVCKGRLNTDLDLCVVGRGMKDPCTVGHIIYNNILIYSDDILGDRIANNQNLFLSDIIIYIFFKVLSFSLSSETDREESNPGRCGQDWALMVRALTAEPPSARTGVIV